MIRYLFVCIAVIAFAKACPAQTSDLARIEFTYFPQSDSDNSFRRFRTFFNFPIAVGKKEGSYLLPGIEYRNVNLKLGADFPFPDQDLERFQNFAVKLGYTFKLNDKWRFGALGEVRAASNFATNELKSDDILYLGSAYFIRSRDYAGTGDTKDRLILGVQYSTVAGRPFPLPIVNYHRKLQNNWEYTVGVPKMNLRYRFNEEHALQAFVTLDGFFANIQNDQTVNNDEVADSISMTTVLSGLGYEYNFSRHLLYYLYAGYTLNNEIRMRNSDGDDVFIVNDANTFYLRSGVKFKI